MKKRIIVLFLFILCLTLFGCSNKEKDDDGSIQYEIYKLANDAGYDGTYEEWLASIAGEDGKSIELVIEENDIK